MALESAAINLTTDVIKAVLLGPAYTYSAAHQFVSSLTAIVGGPGTLTSTTINAPGPGVFDAADLTFAGLTGPTVGALAIYKDTGSAATSPLIAFIDGIALVPNGGDVILQFDSGPNRIFAL